MTQNVRRCSARLALALALMHACSTTAQAGPSWATSVCERLFSEARPGMQVLPSHKTVAWNRPVETQPGQKKILILSSGFGMGHNSTSRAMEKAIQMKDPNTLIMTIEIEALQHPKVTSIEQWLFWTTVKKAPWLYDLSYKIFMRKAARRGLKGVRQNVEQSMLEEFIAIHKPDVIIAAHQMTAAGLALMRQKGLLRDTKVGFVATDYFVEFLPEVSKLIDATFVAHPKLKEAWISRGVTPDKVSVTGMPVNPEAFKPVDKAAFLSERGLDPNVRTITLASGGEGVGNYPKIVKSLARAHKGQKLQIIAICGKNEAHFKKLSKMVEPLRTQGVALKVLGFTQQPEMFGYIKSSDLYITKSGGLSPSEGFAMNKPMILMDVYGGHERVNAVFFEGIDVALINRNQGRIGQQAAQLLNDPIAQERMMRMQRKVTQMQNFSVISEFALPSESR